MAAQAAGMPLRALVRMKKATAALNELINGAAGRLARIKHESQIYQTMRGDRVTPEFPMIEERKSSTIGRRAKREVTEFLQVSDRLLQTREQLDPKSSMFCLGCILCILEGDKAPSRPSIKKMKDCIRLRLKDAP
jgi:hypothetical protein